MRQKAPKNKMEVFSKNLKALRARSGFTQEELAEESGMSLDAIKFYETGRRYPSLRFLTKLIDPLECTIDDLTNENGPRSLADDLYKKIKSAVDAAVKTDVSDDEREWLRLIRQASPERLQAARYILQEQAPTQLSQKKKASK